MTETGTNGDSHKTVNGVYSTGLDEDDDNDDDEEFGRFEVNDNHKSNIYNTNKLQTSNTNKLFSTMNGKAAKSIDHSLDHERTITSNPTDEAKQNNFGVKETKAVSCLRLVVLAVLVVSATCTAIAVYFYTRNSELRAFESEFYSDAENLIHGAGHSLYVTLGAMDSYVLHVVSQARDTNQQFPFVTTPDNHVHMAKLGSIGNTIMMQQAHFVSSQQRMEWENYTAHNNQWISDSIQQYNSDIDNSTLQIDPMHVISAQMNENTIHTYDGPSINDGPFLPTWQCYPIIPGKSFL